MSGLHVFECAAPEVAWDGEALELRRSLRCGDPGVIGPFYDATARSLATLVVETPGVFTASFASEEPASLLALTSCAGCDGDWVAEVLAPGEAPRELVLPAGRLALEFAGPSGPRTAMALRLQRVAGAGP